MDAEVGGKALSEDLSRGVITTGGTGGGGGSGGASQNNVGQSVKVEGNDAEQFEIQWHVLFKNDTLGMMLITPDLVTGATANLAMQILRPTSDFNGTKAVVKALSTALHGRLVQSTVATTLNHTPAPIQVTRTDGYLKATSTTVTGVAGIASNTLRVWLGIIPWRDVRHLQTLAWMMVGLLSCGHAAFW